MDKIRLVNDSSFNRTKTAQVGVGESPTGAETLFFWQNQSVSGIVAGFLSTFSGPAAISWYRAQ